MKLKIKNHKWIELFLSAFLVLGCGTWIGSPDEEDEGTNAQQEQPNEDFDSKESNTNAPDLGAEASPPISDGVWEKVDLPEDEVKTECENFILDYRADEEDPKILELANADAEDENTITFESVLPDDSTEDLAIVNLAEIGNYKINVSYDDGESVSECVLYLGLLELKEDESYKLEFIFE